LVHIGAPALIVRCEPGRESPAARPVLDAVVATLMATLVVSLIVA
jgi:hypothetical protein